MQGDLVTIALRGDFGKPRPAVVIQADQFDQYATVTILPVTSTLVPAPLFRVAVQPKDANGLQSDEQKGNESPLDAYLRANVGINFDDERRSSTCLLLTPYGPPNIA